MREGPTQAEFAELMSVSQGTIARWEGGAKPEIEHIVRMADLAGVSVPVFTGQLLGQDRPAVLMAGGAILLPVQLPNEEALSEMFEGLLETMPNNDPSSTARKLAQLLPNALAQTVSHPRGGIAPADRRQPLQEAPGAAPKSDRAPRR